MTFDDVVDFCGSKSDSVGIESAVAATEHQEAASRGVQHAIITVSPYSIVLGEVS